MTKLYCKHKYCYLPPMDIEYEVNWESKLVEMSANNFDSALLLDFFNHLEYQNIGLLLIDREFRHAILPSAPPKVFKIFLTVAAQVYLVRAVQLFQVSEQEPDRFAVSLCLPSLREEVFLSK